MIVALPELAQIGPILHSRKEDLPCTAREGDSSQHGCFTSQVCECFYIALLCVLVVNMRFRAIIDTLTCRFQHRYRKSNNTCDGHSSKTGCGTTNTSISSFSQNCPFLLNPGILSENRIILANVETDVKFIT